MILDEFTPELLRKIRDGLPQGAMKQLAEKYGIPQTSVYRILNGRGVKSDKCNPYSVLNDAMQIYIEINGVRDQAIRNAEIIKTAVK